MTVAGRGARRRRVASARSAQAAARLPGGHAARCHAGHRPRGRRCHRSWSRWAVRHDAVQETRRPDRPRRRGQPRLRRRLCHLDPHGAGPGAGRRGRRRAAARRPAGVTRRHDRARWWPAHAVTPSVSARTTTGSATRCGSIGSMFETLAGLHGDKAVWKLVDADRRRRARQRSPGGIPRDVDTWDDYRGPARGRPMSEPDVGRGGPPAVRRPRLPRRRGHGHRGLPHPAPGAAAAARGRARRRQDRRRAGAREGTRRAPGPAPVLRGPHRERGALRLEPPAPAARHPDRRVAARADRRGRPVQRGVPRRATDPALHPLRRAARRRCC